MTTFMEAQLLFQCGAASRRPTKSGSLRFVRGSKGILPPLFVFLVFFLCFVPSNVSFGSAEEGINLNVQETMDDALLLSPSSALEHSNGISTASESDAARRMHVVMVSLPLQDHIVPMTALAGELLRRKHAVTFLTDGNDGWCDWIERTLLKMNASIDGSSSSSSSSKKSSRSFTCISVAPVRTQSPSAVSPLDPFVWEDVTVAGGTTASRVHRLVRKVLLAGGAANAASSSMGFHPTYTYSGSRAFLDHHQKYLAQYVAAAAATLLLASDDGPRGRVSFVMGDTLAFVASSVARHIHVPFVGVHLAGHAHLAFDLSPTIAAPGSGFPHFVRGTRNRLANLLAQLDAIRSAATVLQDVNAARITHDIATLRTPWDVYGLRSMMLVPSIWGAPWHQRFCGNVHLTGSLAPSAAAVVEDAEMTAEVMQLLSRVDTECESGAVYIHLASVPATRGEVLAFMRMTAIALQDVSDLLERGRRNANMTTVDNDDEHQRAPLCAIWSLAMNRDDAAAPMTRITRALDVISRYGAGFRVRNHFVHPTGHNRFFPAPAILHHPRTALFMSDCSTTAVSMGLESGVPMIGVPVMHREGDTCARLGESAFGRAVRLTSRAEHLFTAILSLARSSGAGPREGEEEMGACWMISNRSACKRQRIHFHSLVNQLHLEGNHFLGGVERAVDLVEQRYLNGLLDCMPSRPPQQNATECTYFEACAYVEATASQPNREGLVYGFWRHVGPALAMDAPASWYWTVALLCDVVPSAAELQDHLPAILLVCVLSAWWFYVLHLMHHVLVHSAHLASRQLTDILQSVRCFCTNPLLSGSANSQRNPSSHPSQRDRPAGSLRATVIPRRSQSEHTRPRKQ